VLCPASFLFGQQNKLRVIAPDLITIKRGATATAPLKVTISPGLHVNSNKPADAFLIPLSIEWTSGPLQARGETFPPPERIKVGNQELSVFTGTIQVNTQFKAPPGVAAGPATMIGKIHYQACNDQMCFRPGTVDVRVPVSIE